MPSLRFLGASGTVTGSRYLVTTERARVLVDCGLFQGARKLKALNWEPLPFPPAQLDAVVLSHAHLDHSGYLPRLIRDGYGGKAFCTFGTADLASILLPDAGFLQEEEAAHANRKRWSRHVPAEPLFTLLDAQRALRHLRPVAYGAPREVAPGVTVRFHPAGHIIGAAIVELVLEERAGRTTLLFSGDLGRTASPLLAPPATFARADYVLVESTYGDRLHPPAPERELARVVREAAARGGMLVMPSFAVGRTQELLYVLRRLEDAGEVPALDVYLDSPMAIDATAITLAHLDELNPEAAERARSERPAFVPRRLRVVRDAEQSRALNALKGPGIILSASGMCTGGRVKHHLRHRLPDPSATVCLVGFQAAGTRGRALQDGAREVHLFGEPVPVAARVECLDGFSAHADRHELLAWLGAFEAPPRGVFVVHGEPENSRALAEHIERALGWKARVPELGELIALPVGRHSDLPTISR